MKSENRGSVKSRQVEIRPYRESDREMVQKHVS